MIKGKYSLVIVSLLVFLSACNQNEDQAESIVKKDDVVQQEDEPVVAEVKAEESVIYPLTGIATEEQNITQRPVAVMINNHPKARPQSGLTKADVVYEVLAEGNITRFLAVFQSEVPDIIGPVRSARDYYIDISKGFHALYISHGWSPSAKERLVSNEVDHINGMLHDGTLFWRADHRNAPHNSYISKDNILQGAELKQYTMMEDVIPFDFLTEEEMKEIKGEQVNKFVIKYDKSETWQSTYEYNQTEQTYKRYSGNEDTVDLESGDSVELTNIFVVQMKHKVIDKEGRRTIDMTSGGKALLMQKGMMQEVEWENHDGRILPVKDGEVVKLVPGRTWVNVVPSLDQYLIQS
ncbi:DUF3048 domain-containing protein [Metabacillus litoralis]|uniref:DUF3048 domain-containing protein n=1 Tax=Metabacillus litoralis TaxID=152268 RepID=UPI00203CD385|nr:DUF3048 domain-containing protein [Metabacillus litoralis]MCM3412383.1 DUF3048 domain-containing protein [Metabacillus litoralis]